MVSLCINPKCRAELPVGANYCPRCGKKQAPSPRHKRVRANGQGTVYKLPNGKWRAEKTLGYKVEPLPPDAPPGAVPKKKRIAVTDSTFTTKTAALAALPSLGKKRPAAGRSQAAKEGTKIKLKALYDQWEPTHDCGRSTLNCYRAGFRIFADLWYTPMEEIDIDDLQDCMDDTELGKKSKANGRTALGLVYKYGIPRGCVPRDLNLAQFLKIRGADSVQRSGFSRDELEKIRLAAEKGDEAAMYVFCHCYLGFRPTALLKLRKADYNEKEKAFVGGIKTEAGIDRTVTVSPKIQPLVDALLQPLSAKQYVFGNKGAQISIKTYRTMFYDLLDRLKISNPIDEQGRHRLTPHSCRHTFATLLKRVSGSDTDKLALIGHTTTEQLRDYQDVDYQDLRAITDQL